MAPSNNDNAAMLLFKKTNEKKRRKHIEINKRGCENNNIFGPFVRYQTVASNSVKVMMIELN